MVIINPSTTRRVDRLDFQSGIPGRIIILSERDLLHLDTALCGQDPDLVIVPREVTKEEKEHIDNALFSSKGSILILK